MQLALTLFAYAADLDRNMCIDASVILLNRLFKAGFIGRLSESESAASSGGRTGVC